MQFLLGSDSGGTKQPGGGEGSGFGGVVGRMIAPKDKQVLVLRTCDYVTSCGKRDFADVVKDLRLGRLSWVFCDGIVYY